MDQQLNYLLDRKNEFGREQVKVLDDLTLLMSSSSPQVARDANMVWNRLIEDDYFWYHSGKILEMAQVNETKVFALVILEDAIKVPPSLCSKNG
jgi:hypothetical protein